MSDSHKLFLFVALVGLSVVAGRGSAKLAREIGAPTLLVGLAVGVTGHILAEST